MTNAKETKQELIMAQIDLEKTYNNVNWSFVRQLMAYMGFDERMLK